MSEVSKTIIDTTRLGTFLDLATNALEVPTERCCCAVPGNGSGNGRATGFGRSRASSPQLQ